MAMNVITPALAQAAQPADKADPYIWLEDKDGPRAMQWVTAENAKTLPRLQGDPHYAQFYSQAYAIASAQDRIAVPELANGRIVNFWRDDAHPHGLWRWTTQADYMTATPHWTTLIDVEALGKAEGKDWVWQGGTCLPPEERRCLVALSEGGEDATSYREFDLVTGRFVAGGFALLKSKQNVAWLDADTLLVARDWGSENGQPTMTASGYPFIVKQVRRGQQLDQATEVFRGMASDVNVSARAIIDAQGHRIVIGSRGVTFFRDEHFVLADGKAVKLPVPDKSSFLGMVDGRVLIKTDEDWAVDGRVIPAGTLLSVDHLALNGGALSPMIVFQPGPTQSVEGAVATRARVVITVLDNVVGRMLVATPTKDGWTSQRVVLPDQATLGLTTSDLRSDTALVSVTSFLTPTSLWTFDAGTAVAARQVKSLPPRFDTTGMVVEQFAATSTDGTKVPYFVVHRRDVVLDGTTPTIMTAYGGFQVSNTPYYSGVLGKLWLERGGAFVLANIRGGGEFGPAWHEAGRKGKRQIVYDDFAAVARDIFARKLSAPAKFGIYGGSNGGLLMGVEMEQHPELWHAVVIEVPLLDMLRYEQIQAGASWVDEYGSVSVPAEKAFLQTISPYHNLKKGADYPEPYIWTTTKDDRVGPQHARKFAARMAEYGQAYLFFEDTAGGHAGDADLAQGARLRSMEMVYFTQKLMGK